MMYSRTTSIHSSRRKRTRLTTSRLRRSRLLMEVAMRKLNLDPEKTEQMELISDQLSEDDIHFFTHIFSQIDSAWLIIRVLLQVVSFAYFNSFALHPVYVCAAQLIILGSSCATSCMR